MQLGEKMGHFQCFFMYREPICNIWEENTQIPQIISHYIIRLISFLDFPQSSYKLWFTKKSLSEITTLQTTVTCDTSILPHLHILSHKTSRPFSLSHLLATTIHYYIKYYTLILTFCPWVWVKKSSGHTSLLHLYTIISNTTPWSLPSVRGRGWRSHHDLATPPSFIYTLIISKATP